ncbi:MAG: glycogen synthase GlgA [Gammaproteobacteria bacterium]
MNRILFVSSEVFPLIKTGGLGDVAGSLPRALYKNQQDVRILLPAYREVLSKIKRSKPVARLEYQGHSIRLLETTLPGSHIKTWLVDYPPAYDRPGNPYLDAKGKPWDDNAFRFALFSQIAVDIAMGRCKLKWQPDIVHCNDWQSGLVPALLSDEAKRPATVFTIHNLAYQGLFPFSTFDELKIAEKFRSYDALEYHGQLSFIKGGLNYADRINTVSPTYAREIQQPEFGYGLDGLLRYRKDRLSGILNGIDTRVWNPGQDPYLLQNYNRRSLSKKPENKTQLQRQLKLPVDETIPMFAMVSRLVEQKGLETILSSLDSVKDWPIQIVVLGTGEKKYEQALKAWAKKHPKQMAVIIGYDEQLSHRIEAASDMYLMPSTFEPCGLNQLYSLRYGSLPVARNVGGLADTVTDTTKATIKNKTANGFVVPDDSPKSLLTAMENAIAYYRQPAKWKQLQLNAMAQDHSWQKSAEQYTALYQQALQDRLGQRVSKKKKV